MFMKVVLKRTFDKRVKFLYKGGELIVEANWKMSLSKIKQLISENYPWILSQKTAYKSTNEMNSMDTTNHLLSVRGRENNVPSFHSSNSVERDSISYSNIDPINLRALFNYEKTLLLGKIYDIKYDNISTLVSENEALVLPKKIYFHNENRIKAINSYLKKMANLYVSAEISTIGTQLSLCPQKIAFCKMSNWTNCNMACSKSLVLNYKIVQLPSDLRSFIIIHSFVHFIHKAHDDAFWNYMLKILPNFTMLKEKLLALDFLLDLN